MMTAAASAHIFMVHCSKIKLTNLGRNKTAGLALQIVDKSSFKAF
jgi:hypothetical protein